jgi:hypothetical protein
MKSLFETLATPLRNHADLVIAGIDSETASRIVFDPLKQVQDEVDDERLNEAFRRAFIWGQMQQLKLDNGRATQSDFEAMEACIEDVRKIL